MTIKQLVVRYTPPQFAHWGRCVLSKDYRNRARHLSKLRSLPRYQSGFTEILGKPIELVDSASFLWMYKEIFEQQIYRFETDSAEPYIIDGGSNIGLSVLYFKNLYPSSRIVAFEPDRKIFKVLEENLARYGYHDVELHCRALWTSEGSIGFYEEGADGGRLARGDSKTNSLVSTTRLRDYLDREVDFLKLDIEGAETDVLLDSADRLGKVRNLFVEYHSFEQQPQSFHILTRVLFDAGFRLHVHPPVTSAQPFIKRDVNEGMDMQLNVFAFR
jgi:FkbM family methyltransferase